MNPYQTTTTKKNALRDQHKKSSIAIHGRSCKGATSANEEIVKAKAFFFMWRDHNHKGVLMEEMLVQETDTTVIQET